MFVERETLIAWLAEGLSLEQIGRRVGLDHSTVGYWVKKHDLKATHADRCAPRGGIDRDVLKALAAQGLSMVDIAGRLNVGVSTVRYWAAKHELTVQTARGTRTRLAREAREAGFAVVVMRCRVHGDTKFRVHAYGRSRCLRCRSEAVVRRRRKVKRTLVAEAGGRCVLCGYNRCVEALEFHHLDRETKAFAISHRGVARALDSARREAAKCVLVCANCHAEVEAGHVSLASGQAMYHIPG